MSLHYAPGGLWALTYPILILAAMVAVTAAGLWRRLRDRRRRKPRPHPPRKPGQPQGQPLRIPPDASVNATRGRRIGVQRHHWPGTNLGITRRRHP